METTKATKTTITLTISYAFSPAVNKSPHAAVIKCAALEVTHWFSAAATTVSLGKGCLCSPSFINTNGWKTEGTKSRLYCGYGRTVQAKLAMCSMIFKLPLGLALSLFSRKVVFFSDLTLEI